MENQLSKNDNILANRICSEYFTQGTNKHIYLPVSEVDFSQIIPLLAETDIVLIGLLAVENMAGRAGFTLLYILEKRGCSNIVIIQRSLQGKEAASIAEHFPAACWYEREIRDGFGIEFTNAFDQRRLFLHEAYPTDFHPLLKAFNNRTLSGIKKDCPPDSSYPFKEVAGEGVYQVLVGPVHAGIIEPGHFHFSVIGETIANLEVRMFYKHRGIEKLAEGKIPLQCLPIAESISGDESVANAAGFCMAVEMIAEIKVPLRAWYLRTILLEMERIYSHLGDMAGMIVDVAFPVGASEFHILREEILRYNDLLTGSRFLKGIIAPGGLARDIPTRHLLALTDYLGIFISRFKKAVNFVHNLDSVLDRLETTGVINPSLVNPLNISGPAARASGAKIDTRLDHPYGIYADLKLVKRFADKGDVLCRFDVKTEEVLDSVGIIQHLIEGIDSGPINSQFALKDGCGLALIEAARGQSLHWVYLKNGLVDRYKVRTASFCNWQVIEHAVMGNIVPDFPLINKSLNLSYAGTDL